MQTAAELVRSPRSLIVAHRGACDRAPENTLPAFEAALALGADVVELDYHHSSDGVPVVFHDEFLDKTTDASLRWNENRPCRIADEPWQRLAELDAGGWFDPAFAGTPIPRLSEAIHLVCPRGILAIERKSGDPETLCALLRTEQAVDRVVVMAFEWGFLEHCRRLEPALVTVALGDKGLTESTFEMAVGVGASIVGWDHRSLGPDSPVLIRSWRAEARRNRLSLWAWTIDEPRAMRNFFAASIGGVITNRVDLALAAR